MCALELPRRHLLVLHEHAVRLIERRKPGTDLEVAARELLVTFHDSCLQAGLDGVLADIAQAFAPLDLVDGSALANHDKLVAAVVAQLQTKDLDGPGPRNARPGQLADSVVAALGLTVVDDVERTITLDDAVRRDVVAAMTRVVADALALPHLRETIIRMARAACPEQYIIPYGKLAAQLDDHGQKLLKTPKVPLDAVQAVQRLFHEARTKVFDRMVRAALDAAQAVITGVDPTAAARLDEPVSLRLTPRDVACLRVGDARVIKATNTVVAALVATLSEVAGLAFRAAEIPVRPYAASQTFAVGEVLSHPKFGQGTVTVVQVQRIDVEFEDGTHTLVHARTPA